MARQIINVGVSPNDGTGDSLRTSFTKCNDNFQELYSRVQDTPPSGSVGTSGDTAGMIAYDGTYFYWCIADYDGSTLIWRRVSGATF